MAKWRISNISTVRSPSPTASNAAFAAFLAALPRKWGRLARTLLAAIARRSPTRRSIEVYETETRSTSTTGLMNPASTRSGARADASILG